MNISGVPDRFSVAEISDSYSKKIALEKDMSAFSVPSLRDTHRSQMIGNSHHID